jgi:nucleoside-triphosphatase THEP1
MAEFKENVLEWLNGQTKVTCTLNDPKYIRIVKELAKKKPDKVTIDAENKDGSIVATIPKSAIKINIVTRELTEEQRAEMSERMKKLHKK